MIGICEVPPPDVPMNVTESSLLLPLPGQDKNSIVFENRDGSDIKCFRGNGVVYSENQFTVAKASKLDMAIYVTDARVAFACTRYDKGGGWTGAGSGAVLAIPLNAASMARAAYRRRGKMLVGQVRYQSLGSVGSGFRSGLLNSANYLTLGWAPTSKDRYEVELMVGRDVDVSVLAAEIVRRAAKYVLRVDPKLTDDKRTKLESLLDAKPLQHVAAKKIYLHHMLSFHKENETTARFGLEE